MKTWPTTGTVPPTGGRAGGGPPQPGAMRVRQSATAASLMRGLRALYPAGGGTARGLGSPYSSNTDTTLVSEPEAPWLSVTVTVIVKLCGRTMTYVWPTLNEPWLVTVPVETAPSPQSIRYDHGPSLLASLKLGLNEYSRPVTAVSSGPALTTGGVLGVTPLSERVVVTVMASNKLTIRDGPPLTVQFVATPEIATVWVPAARLVSLAVALMPSACGEPPSPVTVTP